jgi:hypothetical protein
MVIVVLHKVEEEEVVDNEEVVVVVGAAVMVALPVGIVVCLNFLFLLPPAQSIFDQFQVFHFQKPMERSNDPPSACTIDRDLRISLLIFLYWNHHKARYHEGIFLKHND